jgi:hypothetical protein
MRGVRGVAAIKLSPEEACQPSFVKVGFASSFTATRGPEPRHIHVQVEARVAKLWLQPVRLADAGGLSARDLAEARRVARPSASRRGTRSSAADVRFFVVGAEGLTVWNGASEPLAFMPWSASPRLRAASAKARQRVELLGGVEGLHWPEVDEDLSVAGIVRDYPVRSRRSA